MFIELDQELIFTFNISIRIVPYITIERLNKVS